MAVTNYQANLILNRGFGSSTWNPVGTLYIGLSSTPINADGTGATEPGGSYAGGYARVAITNSDKTNWSTAGSPTAATISNLNAVSFSESTTAWFNVNGGPATHVFVVDALTGGNILYYDALNPTRAVQSGTTLLFAAGALQFTMTNS